MKAVHHFAIGRSTYAQYDSGAVRHLNPRRFEYSAEYARQYLDLPIDEMARLRMRVIHQLGLEPGGRILDVGFGAGAFLKHAVDSGGWQAFGFDIHGASKAMLPDGAEWAEGWKAMKWDVACFFDVLEHLPDLDWLEKFDAKTVLISLPNSPLRTGAGFAGWKHRKPDEHLWHFDLPALVFTMAELGWRLIYFGNPEDEIRQSQGNRANILTAAFRRFDGCDHWTRAATKLKGMAIHSHGGVGTNYFLNKFRIQRMPPGAPHSAALVSKVPTFFIYGDFQNAIQSQENRNRLEFNTACLEKWMRDDAVDAASDPRGLLRLVYRMAHFPNVALINYEKMTAQTWRAACNHFGIECPEIEIKKRGTETANRVEYSGFEFPALAFGGSAEAAAITKRVSGRVSPFLTA